MNSLSPRHTATIPGISARRKRSGRQFLDSSISARLLIPSIILLLLTGREWVFAEPRIEHPRHHSIEFARVYLQDGFQEELVLYCENCDHPGSVFHLGQQSELWSDGKRLRFSHLVVHRLYTGTLVFDSGKTEPGRANVIKLILSGGGQ